MGDMERQIKFGNKKIIALRILIFFGTILTKNSLAFIYG